MTKAENGERDTPASSLRKYPLREQLTQLREMHRQQGELFTRLGRSLAIQDLWADAFEGQKTCMTSWTLERVVDRDVAILEIHRSDGAWRAFELQKVPEELWPSPNDPNFRMYPDKQRRLKRVLALAEGRAAQAPKDKVPGA